MIPKAGPGRTTGALSCRSRSSSSTAALVTVLATATWTVVSGRLLFGRAEQRGIFGRSRMAIARRASPTCAPSMRITCSATSLAARSCESPRRPIVRFGCPMHPADARRAADSTQAHRRPAARLGPRERLRCRVPRPEGRTHLEIRLHRQGRAARWRAGSGTGIGVTWTGEKTRRVMRRASKPR